MSSGNDKHLSLIDEDLILKVYEEDHDGGEPGV